MLVWSEDWAAGVGMESIAGTRECEEAEEGCALRTRDASVAILSESEKVSGLGPPDMCIVNKTSTSYYTSDTLETTSFHYVLGLRVENAASLAAYFAKLTRNQVRRFPSIPLLAGSCDWCSTYAYLLTISSFLPSLPSFSSIDRSIDRSIH